MAAIGSGLGSAGFIVIADDTDPVSVAAGAVALPRDRVVWPVHAVQAGRSRDRPPAREARAEGEGTPEDLVTIR